MSDTDVPARFGDRTHAVEQATEHLIRSMVVFLVQTLVLPTVVLWATGSWSRSLFDAGRRE